MTLKNCYTCRRPEYHAPIRASSEGPGEPAYFECEPLGCTGVDEIDEEGDEFECFDWQPLKAERDVYDNLAANTSPEHARQRMPEMVRAGVTSCGLALVL